MPGLKNTFRFAALILVFCALQFSARAQNLPAAEKELARMAKDLLNHPDVDYKFRLNDDFTAKLTAVLKRPESFDYPFDSLVTVSRMRPADNSFRIFTWYIAEGNDSAFYSNTAHYYYGIIQRKYTTKAGKEMIILIPLMELNSVPKGFESIVTDNYAWFGALYYPPKNYPYIPAYDGHFYTLEHQDVKSNRITEGKSQVTVTYVPGKPRARRFTYTQSLEGDAHYKQVKAETRYYVLMGWNGWDQKSSYKVLDVLTFDPKDSTHAIFGAPIFYFDAMPKARALFKYSDYSTFTMNFGKVKNGPMRMFSREMIVYDHLAAGKSVKSMDMYELGPDGTHDAVSFYKKHGGYFEWYRNVVTLSDANSAKHRKEMEKLQLEAARNDSTIIPDYYLLTKQHKGIHIPASEKKFYRQQKRESERVARETRTNKASMDEASEAKRED